VPFVSYEMNGERVPTVNCPKCGVQRPVVIGVCPNCFTSTAPHRGRLTRGVIIAGVTIGGMIGVGYFVSRTVSHPAAAPVAAAPAPAPLEPTTPDSAHVADSLALVAAAIDETTSVSAPAASSRSAPAAAPKVVTPTPSTITSPVATAAKPSPVDPAMVAPKPAPPPIVAVVDTGRWEYAVANTWVRVRSAPNRGSEMLRMVDSAQRVRLGPPMNGWRPVRVGVDRGWVDPRLFTVVPAPRP
jgi:hypothetical protein